MKIKILNLGPINELCFDASKDLNLIYGENAIGKSYATYCLYSLIKNIKNKNLFFIIQLFRSLKDYNSRGTVYPSDLFANIFFLFLYSLVP